MKTWKKECNYRRVKDENGAIIANVIYMDGVPIKVSDQIYEAYSQMGRRERYLEEQMKKIPHVSIEKLLEADVPIDIYIDSYTATAEDIILEAEDEMNRAELLSKLPRAMAQLTDSEQALIKAIYFENVPLREYARQNSVTLRAIQKRRDSILKKLKKFLSENFPQG